MLKFPFVKPFFLLLQKMEFFLLPHFAEIGIFPFPRNYLRFEPSFRNLRIKEFFPSSANCGLRRFPFFRILRKFCQSSFFKHVTVSDFVFITVVDPFPDRPFCFPDILCHRSERDRLVDRTACVSIVQCHGAAIRCRAVSSGAF